MTAQRFARMTVRKIQEDIMSDEKKKVITISREFGSGGRLIGRRLAEKLNVPYYDKELLDRIAEESGFSREMIEGAEKRAKNSFLYSLASAMGTGECGPESLRGDSGRQEHSPTYRTDSERHCSGRFPCRQIHPKIPAYRA